MVALYYVGVSEKSWKDIGGKISEYTLKLKEEKCKRDYRLGIEKCGWIGS